LPIVSAAWLHDNLKDPRVLVLDIRKPEEFKAGHVPGAFNLTYTAWRTLEKGLDCQLNEKDDLQDNICSVGLRQDSKVVVVGKTDTDRDRVNMTRVAWTLKYAGIDRPSVLDGGYKSWIAHEYPAASGWQKREKSPYKCRWNERVLATKAQVMKRARTTAVVDTRLHEFFSGKELQPPLKRRGHVPGAVNLPYPLVFAEDGSFESAARLGSYARARIGGNLDRQIIVLCCNGQFASSWWFALSEVLGYRNVKIYDGSMEEWCSDPGAPLE
jgi:thiosulfate/3-mercaptopyruvate sulfurtransferase